MCGRHNFYCVGIQCAIVDVYSDGDGATEAKVLRIGAHCSVGEEEDHYRSRYQEVLRSIVDSSKILLVMMAPMAIVYFLPRSLVSDMKAAMIGPGIDMRLVMA